MKRNSLILVLMLAFSAFTIYSAVNASAKTNSATLGKEGDGNDKITICHLPPGNTGNRQTISISIDALPAHLAHGDFVGSCEGVSPQPTDSKDPLVLPPVFPQNSSSEAFTKKKDGGDKITICHLPPGNTGNRQTISISVDAWPAHQAHGDFLGPCDGEDSEISPKRPY